MVDYNLSHLLELLAILAFPLILFFYDKHNIIHKIVILFLGESSFTLIFDPFKINVDVRLSAIPLVILATYKTYLYYFVDSQKDED